MRVWLPIILLSTSSCLSPDATTCGDLLCPKGLVCALETKRCVAPAQLAACADKADGDDCANEAGPAQCLSGICTLVTCGDGVMMKGEDCDDGNRTACDGCTADCHVEGCGNGRVECLEQCDDGTANANAPNAACRTDCRRQRCGDGVVDGLSGEDCDGAAPAAESCVSLGYYGGALRCSAACRADLSSCTGTCGDGVVNGGEFCDGLPPSGQTCHDFGYDIGNVYCGQLCTPSFSTCERLGFVPMQYQGQAFFLNTAWNSGDQVIAGGYEGLLLKWDGTRWSNSALPVKQTIYGLGGTGLNDLYAVGQGGLMAHFDGTNWSVQDAGTELQINAVWASSPTDVFAGARGSLVLHSDGTGAWTEQTNPFTGRVLSLWGFGPRDVFASGVGEIAHYDGTTWTAMSLPQSVVDDERFLYALWGSDNDDMWAVGEAGVILHYDGSTWELVPSAPRSSSTPSLAERRTTSGSQAPRVWCCTTTARRGSRCRRIRRKSSTASSLCQIG